MTTIDVGTTVNIQYHFVYDGNLVTPDNLVGEIFKSGILQGNYNAIYTSPGYYYYEWTPASAGSYELRLTGTFLDTTPTIVHQEFFLIGATDPTYTLGDISVINMLGQLSPIYLEPEIILQLFPEGDLVEITEIIYRKSLELENKLGVTSITDLTPIQEEYLIASTMCELTRIYGVTNYGLGGFGEADSFKLGDLEVSKTVSSGGSSSGQYDIGNADTWCELAAALKGQLSSTSDKLKPVVPGAIYDSVIPVRELKSSDF